MGLAISTSYSTIGTILLVTYIVLRDFGSTLSHAALSVKPLFQIIAFYGGIVLVIPITIYLATYMIYFGRLNKANILEKPAMSFAFQSTLEVIMSEQVHIYTSLKHFLF